MVASADVKWGSTYTADKVPLAEVDNKGANVAVVHVAAAGTVAAAAGTVAAAAAAGTAAAAGVVFAVVAVASPAAYAE